MDHILPKRKHTRLKHFNYAQAGYCFVTICTHNRRRVLGSISGSTFCESPAGEIVRTCWENIPGHNPLTHLDEFVIMPNHLHGIVVLEWNPTGDACVAPTNLRSVDVHPGCESPGPDRRSLSAIIGSYKAAVSKRLRWRQRHTAPLWQRGFYDRVIRTDEELHIIREYIANNPLSWHLDELNAERTGQHGFYQWLVKL